MIKLCKYLPNMYFTGEFKTPTWEDLHQDKMYTKIV